MMRRTLENRNAQTKQLQTAVSNVEKHFGELCQIFAAYVWKTARLRDKADHLVNEINAYATPHLKLGLMNFADEFAKLQDYRQAEVERLEAKVVEPLAYGTIVKMKRDDLKATFTARNREAKQLPQLESDMLFHRQKRNYRELQWMLAEQVYIAAYRNIQNIDEDEDLEVFRNSLYAPDYSSCLDTVRANSKSPLQRSLSAKCVSGTRQVSTCRLRKDQQAEDDEDEELDI
uniref:CBY1 interacting BAR domain containing 2 n=1 Tax=Gorilla gorilla gorilla TaxID=9595 RepID=A0A2I2Z7A0_GORGO